METIEKNQINLEYLKHRWFFTSNNNLVIGGKSDLDNEEVIKNYAKKSYVVMHTSEPGSPFMIIQAPKEKLSKKDIEETAIATACFSYQWKNSLKNKKIEVHIFSSEQISKPKTFKKGSFKVSGKIDSIFVSMKLGIIIQKAKLRAVPLTSKTEYKEKIMFTISRGNLTKEQAIKELKDKLKTKYNLLVSYNEIASALPSDKIKIGDN